MRNNIIKRRLEYSMLAGILFNFISLFIPIINLTLTSETKQYTEGYSVGSLVKFLVPAGSEYKKTSEASEAVPV